MLPTGFYVGWGAQVSASGPSSLWGQPWHLRSSSHGLCLLWGAILPSGGEKKTQHETAGVACRFPWNVKEKRAFLVEHLASALHKQLQTAGVVMGCETRNQSSEVNTFFDKKNYLWQFALWKSKKICVWYELILKKAKCLNLFVSDCRGNKPRCKRCSNSLAVEGA